MSEHTHTHDHEHHDHHHDHGAIDSPEKLKALLDHMHQHNVHHTEELHGVAHAFSDQGKAELSEKIHEAMRFYDQGNDLLAEVLKSL